jgi:hypothetical protein
MQGPDLAGLVLLLAIAGLFAQAVRLWKRWRTGRSTPVDWIAAERPSRRAEGAVFSSQLSNSPQLPQRWKRPSTGETTRTSWSV